MLNYSNTKVTMELRDVLASTNEKGEPFKLWDFDYPSYYKGEAKTAFEQKVIDHYLFHQIGCETIARFKHNFKTRVREIMPYYLQMYKSVEIMDKIEDPFGNIDITETFEETSTGTANNTENGTSSSSATANVTESGSTSSTNTDSGTSSSTESATKTDIKSANENVEHRFSNTPHGTILNLADHLTEASTDIKDQSETINSDGTVTTDNESESTSTTEGETSRTGETITTDSGETSRTSASETAGTVTHTLTRKGNQGVNTYAHDMIEFRQSFINVDMMIIGALRDLFLLVY